MNNLLPVAPRSILLIKSYSLGVGDLLQSSAAWLALQQRWPKAQLHLLFLSKHAGYPTEQLMHEHPCLTSAHFITIRAAHPGVKRAARTPIKQLRFELRKLAQELQPDVIIDCEMAGLRTALVSYFLRRTVRAQQLPCVSIGVGQDRFKALFYDVASISQTAWARQHRQPLPLRISQRDFVVLSALGILPADATINLALTENGRQVQAEIKQQLRTIIAAQPLHYHPPEAYFIGLNIGCGTPDALHKRPPLDQLAQAIGALLMQQPCHLLLTGATNERAINQAFLMQLQQCYPQLFANHEAPTPRPVILDWAGQCDLSGLTGAIAHCKLFISTDSGPYHMAVALRVPTLVWFVHWVETALHDVPWNCALLNPDRDNFLATASTLWRQTPHPA